MKKLLLLGGLALTSTSFAQTVLFEDDFENQGSNWTLNSTDLSGTQVTNKWLVNNVYAGGDVTYNCMSSTIVSVNATPSQPATLSTPNSYYMHITSIAGINSGVLNANHVVSNMYCPTNETNFAKMTNGVSTLGYSDVTFSFWTLLGAIDASFVGQVYYSVDNGTTWTQKLSSLNSISAWKDTTITDANWDNVADLRFAFRFSNSVGYLGLPPSFSVDDVKITGVATGSSITTQAIIGSNLCAGVANTVSVPFNVVGTVNAGNTYTAYLSDATGSFSSPTVIGTLSSTSTGSQTISATIPAATPVGTAYRIRVDASNPGITGTDNGSNLTISASPVIMMSVNPVSGIICQGASAVLSASGGTTYSWSPATGLDNSTAATVNASPATSTTYTVTGTNANGCSGTATFTITVENCAGIVENNQLQFEIYPNPASDIIHFGLESIQDVRSIRVLDISGREIAKLQSNTTFYSVADLQNGNYFVVVEHASGTSMKTFVKK